MVSSAEAVTNANLGFAFTDGHAIMHLSQYYDNLSDIDKIDWPLMRSRYWFDTNEDGDRKRRRQAEFLVYRMMPWSLIREVAVQNKRSHQTARQILDGYRLTIPIVVKAEWYY